MQRLSIVVSVRRSTVLYCHYRTYMYVYIIMERSCEKGPNSIINVHAGIQAIENAKVTI